MSKYGKKGMALGVALLLLGSITGCSAVPISGDTGVYEEAFSFSEALDDYYLYRHAETWMVEEKNTGEQYPLFLNPLEESSPEQQASCLLAGENTVYYLCSPKEYCKEIRCVNLDTGDRRTVYRESIAPRRLELFGVTIWQEEGPGFAALMNVVERFCFVPEGLVVIRPERVCLVQGHRTKTLYDGVYRHITCDGEQVYIVDKTGELHRADFAASKAVPLGVYPLCPQAHNGKVYFLDTKAGGRLAVLNGISGEKEYLTQETWESFETNGEAALLKDVSGRRYLLGFADKQLRPLHIDVPFDELVLCKDSQHVALIQCSSGETKNYTIRPVSDFTDV